MEIDTQSNVFKLHEAALESTYEFPYALVKEAVFQLYLWGLETDNDDVISFYKRMMGICRTYDDKFVKPEIVAARRAKEALKVKQSIAKSGD